MPRPPKMQKIYDIASGKVVKRPIFGYFVSSARFPKVRFYHNFENARQEARRQASSGASESGVSEMVEDSLFRGLKGKWED